MHDDYLFPGPTGGTTPTRFASTANLANNTTIISNANDTFELLTDTQVVALLYMGLYTSKVPTCSVNDMFCKIQVCRLSKLMKPLKLLPMLSCPSFGSGYVNLHPIRNLNLISNALGTHNSMAVNGEWEF